ncbi:ferric reductase-like transmembrane domain-containing protein [Paenibacillus sp. P25]|nr:ferric reductase-like transmembrane domain-containing protein [Paenibacillus sp. P25]
MTGLLLALPTWWIIRIAGLAAYGLLFAGVALGITYSMPVFRGADKARLYRWHSWSTNAGLLTGPLHGILLTIDTYMPFSWTQLLIPFSAPKDAFWNGLGTLAMYGLILIILTTDFKSMIPAKLWKYIHLTAYPVFLASMIHGLGSGTDSGLTWIRGFYGISCAIIGVLTILRIYMALRKTGGQNHAHSARGGRREAGDAGAVQAGPAVSQRGLGTGRGNR